MLRLLLLGLASQALAYAGMGAGAAVARRAAPQMAAVAVADFQGASAGEEQVNLKVAKAGGYVVHRKVVAEQANMRLGTAVAKTRAEVRGGGRKPYQQKGTGRARRGSSRSPLLVGGGYLGSFILVVGIGVLKRLGLVSLPPINTLTDIANNAMDDAIAAGTLQPLVATAWATNFWLDLLRQYYAFDGGDGPSSSFIATYCADHASYCAGISGF